MTLKVEVYEYSLHVCNAAAASLCGSPLLLRRALDSMPLPAALIKSTKIVKASVDSLQKILEHYQCSFKKASTKTAKIKEIMGISDIKNKTTAEERQKVEELLAAMDAKRNKRQSAKAEHEQDDEVACSAPQQHPAKIACNRKRTCYTISRPSRVCLL